MEYIRQPHLVRQNKAVLFETPLSDDAKYFRAYKTRYEGTEQDGMITTFAFQNVESDEQSPATSGAEYNGNNANQENKDAENPSSVPNTFSGKDARRLAGQQKKWGLLCFQ